VLLEEAKESYPESIVVGMKSDSIDDIGRWKFADKLDGAMC